ncbi:MAG: hypothetical protein ABSF64_22570 [Bryobacteraceae bacterium]|jgi:uncharacterized protein (TIGR03437 family)
MAATRMLPPAARLPSQALLLFFANIAAPGAPSLQPAQTTTPVFPLDFERSGSAWVARGPAYRLVLRHGNALPNLSYPAGQPATVGMQIVGGRFAAPAQPLSKVTATATAAIVGQSAEVLFAGLAPGYVGVGQVDVVVPSGLPAGEHMLVIAIGGVSSNEAEIGTQ